ncbi:HAMP domain-containing protein [Candidatus Poribacteria bacterium]|nr:HAMP domain-containing protein [Candidatus Poribacteria bacterium]
MSGKKEYIWGIQTKLSLVLGGLVLFSLASFGLLAYFITKNTLDAQLGDQLIAQAQMATTTLRYEADVGMLSRTPLSGETAYSKLHAKLISAKDVAELENMILFDQDNRVIADANSELKVGEIYPILEGDKVELESVWSGNPKATILYPDENNRLYKAAYAPVLNSDNEIVAALRVEASAAFLGIIQNVGFVFLIIAAFVTAAAALLGMLIAHTIVIPIRKLVSASQSIARGNLDTEVFIKSRDEIGFLGRTFNQMTVNLRKLYEEVEQRSRQIVELSASVAHEVRSPISAIQGFTELLEEDMDENDPGHEYIADIKREIKTLNSKITDFIHFAKPMEIELIPLDITEIIYSAMASMDKEVLDNNVSVITNLDDPLPLIQGDFEQLRSLFTNLIRNAIQSMVNGGTLIINAEPTHSENDDNRQNQYLMIKVEDNGCGMSEDSLERAFEPFFTTKGSGTGLGLAIVNKIIQAHDGRIELQTELDKGTTVKVFLPVLKDDEEVLT